MPPTVQAGAVNPRVRALIVGACAVSIAIAYEGMQSLWELAEFTSQRSELVYGSGLALAMAAAIACAWLPRFDVSRLVRVAVLLPIFHLVAIFVAARMWVVLDGDIRHALREWDLSYMRGRSLPTLPYLGIAFAGVLAIAVLIKRRHGEWAHAAVMLTLAFLLLLGLWLPILSHLSVAAIQPRHEWGYYEGITMLGVKMLRFEASRRILSPNLFTAAAVVPPALLAVAFTLSAFRRPRMFTRIRGITSAAIKAVLPISIVCALSLLNGAWLLYLESSMLLMFALVLAVGALTTLTAATWLRSHHAHRQLRKLPTQTAKIAADEAEPIATLEITSWLRGPHLSVRSFVLDTPQGDVLVRGATLLSPMPAATTHLNVGDHTGVLAAGDHVIVAGRRVTSDGPFRAIDAPEIEMVAAPGARRYRFSDVALVVWRPAVAYLAILVAVALPYLSIFLT